MRAPFVALACYLSLTAVAMATVEVPPAGDGSGTVTQVSTGTGLTGGPITSNGTIAISTVPIANGGTGATDAPTALTNLGAQADLVAADATHDGYLTQGDWVTFNGKQSTLVAADATHDGYLTQGDWSTFDGKADAGDNTDITSLKGVNQIGLGTASPTHMLDIKGKADVVLTGTVSVTASTNVVTGAGTNFQGELIVGAAIKIGAETLLVDAIASNTSLTTTTSHTAGASGVTAYTDRDFIRVNNSANDDGLFSVDRNGNVSMAGDLTVLGGFTQTSLAIAANGGPDDITKYVAITGTTTCVDVDCVGTGTAYLTELGPVILNPEDLSKNLYVASIADDTHFTLVNPAPTFGDMTDATLSTLRRPIASFTTGTFDDDTYQFSSEFTLDAIGRARISNSGHVGPVLAVEGPGPNGFGNALEVGQGKTKLGTAGVAFTAMGVCTVASNTLSTTATNLTCTGVPADAGTAVTCSGGAAFSTPTASGVYCRATGSANQIACNTTIVNTQAMTYTCMWVAP